MMEYLTFSQLGQWTLHKVEEKEPPKSDYTPTDKPFKTYNESSMRGELHEDFGQKGSLHNFGGGKRPKSSWNHRTAGKVSHLMESVYNERNPGIGD